MLVREQATVELVCAKCGRTFRRYKSSIRRNKSNVCSVGCMDHSQLARTHGLSDHPLYLAWCGMKSRCSNPRSKMYSYYGARGVRVCDEWASSFETFHAWALAHGWQEGLELDRTEVDGNYEPGNCRWATRRQQMSNTRKRSDARTSRFKGVSWCSNVGKWRAQCNQKGKTPHIGVYSDEEAAARAYDAVALREYGEFAHINFPRKEGVPS